MQRRDFLYLGLSGLGTSFAMAGSVPIQFIPAPSKEKWAILFGTWCGTARDAAIWISEGMGAIASVFDVRQEPDLAPFDHLVLGTAIRAGKGPQAFDGFVDRNMAKIQGKVRGLFAVCGNLEKPVGPAETKRYVDDYLAKICKAGAVPGRAFSGRITKVLMSEADYKLVVGLYRQLGMPHLKDYDLLRRADCLKFGEEVLNRKA